MALPCRAFSIQLASPSLIRWCSGFGLMLLVACLRPGVRSAGEGEVRLTGTSERTIRGPCVVAAEPGWGVAHPWVVRWTETDGEWKVELRTERELDDGTVRIPPFEAGGSARALVLDGGLVRGAVVGNVRVARRADTLTISLVGQVEHRERWNVEGSCTAVASPTPP